MWNLENRYQNIRIEVIGSFVRKIKERNTSAELSGGRTVLVPKCLTQVSNCPGAELSWCRNVSHRCRSVLVPNCPGAEVSSIPNTTVPTQDNRNLIRSPLYEGENLSIIVLPVNGKLRPSFVRKVWRYQRGNQNPYIEEEQTTQWPKVKVQKDKQRSTKHTYTTKDRVTRTPQIKVDDSNLRLASF